MVALMLAACSPGGGGGNADAPLSSPAARSPSSTTTTDPDPQDWAFGGHIGPSPVLFGSNVLLPDGSGGFRDVTPDKNESESIADAFFVDPEHGWVVLNDFGQSSGRLVRTVDGGQTWEATDLAVSRHPSAGSYIRIYFFDREHGWVTTHTATAGENAGLGRSTDGGRTWPPSDRERSEPGMPIHGPIRFVSPTHGWVAAGTAPGSYQGLFETFDAGNSWKARSVEPPPETPSAGLIYQLPAFFGRRGILAVGAASQEREWLGFYTSADNGRNWRLAATLEEPGSAEGFVSIVAPELWWVLTEDASTVLLTTDAGRSWQRRPTSGLSGVLQELEAKDATQAWARIIETGRTHIRATADGGATWRPMPG